MLQTYEAELQPDGILRFLEPGPNQERTPRRVLVTFTDSMASLARPNEEWRQFAGALKDSPNLNGDPLVIQQEMRHEWE